MTELKKQRIEKGYVKQCHFCRKIGMNHAHYSVIENGIRPNYQTAKRLANALGTTVQKLWPDVKLNGQPESEVNNG